MQVWETPQEAVRALRIRKGWTQEDLARELGVGLRTVGRWEADMPPRGNKLTDLQLLAKRAGDHELANWFALRKRQDLASQLNVSLDDVPVSDTSSQQTMQRAQELLTNFWSDWKAFLPEMTAVELRLRAHMEETLLELADEILVGGREGLKS